MDIKGGVSIVTGSASGVGSAAARLLASKGSNVVINYTKSEAEAKETQAQCEASGAETILCQADVSQDDQCRAMVAEAVDKWGRVDALVNNAGRTKPAPPGDMDAVSAQDFIDIYSVNLIGSYQMSRAVVPHMKAQGNGSIVNMSALGALNGGGSSIAYSSSKGALNAMTLNLARNLAPEIRVNAICPGFIQGRWMRGALGDERYEAMVKNMEETSPVQKASTPEEIADLLVFFITGTDLMTGEILEVDFGLKFGPLPKKG